MLTLLLIGHPRFAENNERNISSTNQERRKVIGDLFDTWIFNITPYDKNEPILHELIFRYPSDRLLMNGSGINLKIGMNINPLEKNLESFCVYNKTDIKVERGFKVINLQPLILRSDVYMGYRDGTLLKVSILSEKFSTKKELVLLECKYEAIYGHSLQTTESDGIIAEKRTDPQVGDDFDLAPYSTNENYYAYKHEAPLTCRLQKIRITWLMEIQPNYLFPDPLVINTCMGSCDVGHIDILSDVKKMFNFNGQLIRGEYIKYQTLSDTDKKKINVGSIPRVCCAPVEYYSFDTIWRDRDNKNIFHKIRMYNGSAKRCACI
ncbi:unnamed protein product [Gordionus sp. m RMFG-2023]